MKPMSIRCRSITPPIAVSFDANRNPAGIEQPACTNCGDCCGGCNVGAKTTVAATYLADAVRHGAEVFSHAAVRHIRKLPGGGWQVAVSAFSKNKQEAVKFARYLSSPEVSKMQAIMASHIPVFPSVYKDPEVLKANPWFAEALPVVESAKARPVSPQYPQVSDAVRGSMNAYLAGTRTTDAALSDMKNKLAPIYK